MERTLAAMSSPVLMIPQSESAAPTRRSVSTERPSPTIATDEWGAIVGALPVERVRGFAESITGARFEIIEDAGHAVVVEKPERVAELSLEFLDALP